MSIPASVPLRLFILGYLMIGKPDLGESLLLIAVALGLGAVTSLPHWRAQLSAIEG